MGAYIQRIIWFTKTYTRKRFLILRILQKIYFTKFFQNFSNVSYVKCIKLHRRLLPELTFCNLFLKP